MADKPKAYKIESIDQKQTDTGEINVNNTNGAITEELRKRFLLGGKTGNLGIRGDALKGLWAGNASFDLAPWWVSLAGVMGYTGVLQVYGEYNSVEYDNGDISGSPVIIDWNNGNVQYATMTGDAGITFANPQAGGRYILHLAGGFTPTFSADCRFTGGVTPTATATAGKKDIYTLIYSGKEGLYDVLQSPNYAIT